MWGWVWTLLVLGALVVLGLLAWQVVRAGYRALRQAARAGEELSAAAARTSEAVAAAEAARTESGPTMFDDPAVLRARVHGLRTARWARRGLRRERQAVVWRRWSTSTWLQRRQAARVATPPHAGRVPRTRRSA
ncbi:hypothetical protein [Isoptericola aurantiacus]|uniref:hypothetical protein n=1 Tax=Isoptericola aurantiacus TaxID=3377839 RepID=UPI00383A9AD5